MGKSPHATRTLVTPWQGAAAAAAACVPARMLCPLRLAQRGALPYSMLNSSGCLCIRWRPGRSSTVGAPRWHLCIEVASQECTINDLPGPGGGLPCGFLPLAVTKPALVAILVQIVHTGAHMSADKFPPAGSAVEGYVYPCLYPEYQIGFKDGSAFTLFLFVCFFAF